MICIMLNQTQNIKKIKLQDDDNFIMKYTKVQQNTNILNSINGSFSKYFDFIRMNESS